MILTNNTIKASDSEDIIKVNSKNNLNLNSNYKIYVGSYLPTVRMFGPTKMFFSKADSFTLESGYINVNLSKWTSYNSYVPGTVGGNINSIYFGQNPNKYNIYIGAINGHSNGSATHGFEFRWDGSSWRFTNNSGTALYSSDFAMYYYGGKKIHMTGTLSLSIAKDSNNRPNMKAVYSGGYLWCVEP